MRRGRSKVLSDLAITDAPAFSALIAMVVALVAALVAVALITILTTMSGKLSQTFQKVSTSLDNASK